MAENGDLDAEMTHRIQSGWKNWKRVFGDYVRPKNKFQSQGESIQDSCKTSNDYGAETWAVKKAQEKKLDVAEMLR